MKITSVNLKYAFLPKKYKAQRVFSNKTMSKDDLGCDIAPVANDCKSLNVLSFGAFYPSAELPYNMNESKPLNKKETNNIFVVDKKQFAKLDDNDKLALEHLVNAARVLNSPKFANNFYPKDLSKEEFHSVLMKMLDDGQVYEVKNILNERTIVKRDGFALKAVDYTKKFRNELLIVADELAEAAYSSTNKDFSKYLFQQISALLVNNPQLASFANKSRKSLQANPLEFVIKKEQAVEKLTLSVLENSELAQKLKENNIVPHKKTYVRAVVGMVDKNI